MTQNRFTARLNLWPVYIHIIMNMIAEIDKLNSSFVVQKKLSPQLIKKLTQSVLITSSGASTRIEGSKLSDREVDDLYKKLRIKKFRTRDEQEVA